MSRALCSVLLAAVLLAAACSDEQPVQTEDTPTGEGVVGRGGGALESADGKVRIEFPLGAVADDVHFKIAPAVNAPTGAALAYVVTPTDAQLLQRARVLFRYADSDISGLSEERLRVSTVDAGQWRVSDSPFLDTDSNQAAGYSRVLATVGLVQAGCLDQSECAAPEVCSGFTCQIVACVANVDCGAGLACVAGACLLLNACGSDDDCLFGELCADIVCLPRADCSVGDGCSDGEHCVEGRCTRTVECQVAADCGEGFACRNNLCSDPLACGSDDLCVGDGERCINGVCTVVECVTDDECPTGQLCLEGGCMGCASDTDCGEGRFCDPASKRCGRCVVATGEGCGSSEVCDSAQQCVAP